jgi:hypothetical protein
MLAVYEQDEHFADRIMLVDNDMIDYFLLDPADRRKEVNESLVPKRLAAEYADFSDGHNPGPLMKQEKLFDRLWNKNNIIKRQVSRQMLEDFRRSTSRVTHLSCAIARRRSRRAVFLSKSSSVRTAFA